jgi:hypothetical protein
MSNRESSAVTDFIGAVRHPVSESGSGAHPRLVRRTPPQGVAPRAAEVAHGTPAPQWTTPPRPRARGTLPPPIPADARRAAPPPIPGSATLPGPAPAPQMTAAPPPIPARASRPQTAAPPPIPQAAPPIPPQAAPPIPAATLPPLPQAALPPLPRPAAPMPRPLAHATPAPVRRGEHPALAADTVPAPRIAEAALEMSWYDEDDEPTQFVPATRQTRALEHRPGQRTDATEIAVMPGRSRWPIVAGVAGGLIGAAAIAAYIASSGSQVAASSAASAPAAVTDEEPSAPAPAATPAVATPAAAAPEPAVVPVPEVTTSRPAVAFISEPSGATVTLIEDGVPHVIGETPIEAIIDPERHYEAMFALAGHATTLQPVEVAAAGPLRVEVNLHPGEAATEVAGAETETEAEVEVEPAEEARAEPAPRREQARKAKRSSKREARTPTRRSEPRRKKVAAAPDGAFGLLALGAKPPCDIYIDGKNTGLQTPQRSIKLAPGKHRVTLVNRDHRIRKSFTVQIVEGKRTRAIQDLTDLIK